MDTAGWVQVLSIGVMCITIFGVLWKVARMYSKIESSAQKANLRIDEMEKREGNCPMGKALQEQVSKNENAINHIKEENKQSAVQIATMQTDIGNIKSDMIEVKRDVKEILTAVKK